MTGPRTRRDAAGTTMPDVEAGVRSSSRSKWGRRAVMSLLAAFVLAGAAGLLGVRSTTTSADAGGVEVDLEHPTITRPGLAASWQLHVRSPDGFDEPIVVRQRASYQRIFDFNDLEPSPDSSTIDGGWIEWEWDAPPTTDFLAVLDVRIEPGVQWPEHGTTVVEAEGERLRLEYETWILP